MNLTTPKELEYRISLPHETEKTTSIGKAEIKWNKCLVFTDGTKKFIKYFKSKKDDQGNQIALRQTYTTYPFGNELRAFRTVVKTNPRTKEIISFVRGSEACREMIADFNLLGIEINKVTESQPKSGNRWNKVIHIGV